MCFYVGVNPTTSTNKRTAERKFGGFFCARMRRACSKAFGHRKTNRALAPGGHLFKCPRGAEVG